MEAGAQGVTSTGLQPRKWCYCYPATQQYCFVAKGRRLSWVRSNECTFPYATYRQVLVVRICFDGGLNFLALNTVFLPRKLMAFKDYTN